MYAVFYRDYSEGNELNIVFEEDYLKAKSKFLENVEFLIKDANINVKDVDVDWDITFEQMIDNGEFKTHFFKGLDWSYGLAQIVKCENQTSLFVYR